MLVARRWIKLALVVDSSAHPHKSSSVTPSHTALASLARPARRNTAAAAAAAAAAPLTPLFYPSASILYTSLFFACVFHRLLVYSSSPPPALRCCLPVCLQACDSKTHVEKRLCFCLLLLLAALYRRALSGLVSLSANPYRRP